MGMVESCIVEEYGKNGYGSFRIPGIVVTAKNTVIIYYEMRSSASDDWSTKAIGMKRSTDGGKTFSERSTIATCEKTIVNNPVMIATQDGKVHFLWQEDYRLPFYSVSCDDGLTFSKPKSLLSTIEKFRELRDWSLYAFGPGHGIELTNGRLVVPIWLAYGKGNDHFPTYISTIVSDDGGENWDIGEAIYGGDNKEDAFVSPNETQAVELSDGSVMLNIRHNGTTYFRYVSVSSDGANGFSMPTPDRQLPDSICFGSLVRAGSDIAFVNCANRENAREHGWAPRQNLVIRLSSDDAKSWEHSRQLAQVGGYADIAYSEKDEKILCFYEHENPEGNRDPRELIVARFDKEWVSKGE